MRIRVPTRRKAARPMRADCRRKNLILDQRLIDRARALLGAASETEAVTRALTAVVDLVAFRREVSAAARAMYGKGRFAHVDDARELDFSGFLPRSERATARRS